jgi:hypothetical protein
VQKSDSYIQNFITAVSGPKFRHFDLPCVLLGKTITGQMDENPSPGQHQDYEDLLPSDCRFHQLMFKKVRKTF